MFHLAQDDSATDRRVLKIHPHNDGPGDFLPAIAAPERLAAPIVVCYQDKCSFKTSPSQTLQTFIHQTLADSARLVSRIDGQMINISAAPVMAAQCDANNRRTVCRNSAQPGIT